MFMYIYMFVYIVYVLFAVQADKFEFMYMYMYLCMQFSALPCVDLYMCILHAYTMYMYMSVNTGPKKLKYRTIAVIMPQEYLEQA